MSSLELAVLHGALTPAWLSFPPLVYSQQHECRLSRVPPLPTAGRWSPLPDLENLSFPWNSPLSSPGGRGCGNPFGVDRVKDTALLPCPGRLFRVHVHGRKDAFLPVLPAPGGLGVSGLQESRWFQPARSQAQILRVASASVWAAVGSPAPAPP